MTDDLTPDPDADDRAEPSRDARDGELAAVLAVAPLDAGTRRQLVRSALERTAPDPARDVTGSASRKRLVGALGIAAALAVGAIVGTVVVTRPPDPAPTAQPRAAAPSAPEAPDAPTAGGSGSSESATRLGDLGAVASAEALRDAISGRLEAGAGAAFDSTAELPCVADGAATAGLVAVSALGTATLGIGTPVVVLVGTSPSGEALGVALDASTCAVLETVTLGA